MRKDLVTNIKSSFLSCEKDCETILKKLFIEHPAEAEDLKRLLLINTKNCLDDRESEVIKNTLREKGSVMNLVKEGYIKLSPKIEFMESNEIRAYIMISFDNFTTNSHNPEFRDCTVAFDVICHTDYWDLGNFRLRPLKILGYIDGLLNGAKLSGIGVLNFLGANEVVLGENLSGYTLIYQAIHGSDDIIPVEE